MLTYDCSIMSAFSGVGEYEADLVLHDSSFLKFATPLPLKSA